MVVDVPRCGPMLSPRVPNLVPIPGITGSAHCAIRPLQGPRDHRLAPPTRCAAPTDRPTRAHRHRPELARSDCGRARATEPSRVAGHPRHAVALAPAPHRPTLDPTTATAGPATDGSGASPTRTAPRSRESDLGLPPHPRRTEPGSATAIAASTVWQILNNAGIDPAPTRSEVTWSQFLRSQAAVACDFATIETVTLRRFYLLFFIDIPTRTVYFAGVTAPPHRRLDHPSGAEPVDPTRPPTRRRPGARARPRQPVHSTPSTRSSEPKVCKILKTPVRTPVANAFAERWIGTLRRELLDRTIIWNRRQLNKLVVDYIDHYNMRV